MAKLLFDRPKKKARKELNPLTDIRRDEYYDIEYIQSELEKLAESPEDLIRVRLIRREPCVAYRATIYKKWTSSHTVKKSDGSTTLLPPGLYVQRSADGNPKQYWIEKVSLKEFVWKP